MKKMCVSRLGFIGGISSCGIVAGCRLFESGEDSLRRPNLRVGILSDIHIQCGCDKTSRHGIWWKTTQCFEKALSWFGAQKVDAVVIAGDLADQGLVEHLQAVSDAWYRVFPSDCRPDSCKVEKVFVTGNHDWDGWSYNDLIRRRFPSEDDRARQIMQNDYAGCWERAFHEPYEPIYMKEVKGYFFIGSHWAGTAGSPIQSYSRIEPFLKKHAEEIASNRPFFYVQHPHPKDTCFGPWAWGHDEGVVTRCLSAFPNAIAISGHSHYPLTDERAIWQGAFTSLGASSLSYTTIPREDRPDEGYENSSCGRKNWRIDAQKLMQEYSVGEIVVGNLYGNSCQGMLLDVFDDRVVIRRRDFANDLDLGSDWTLPLPVAEKRPYAFSTRTKALVAPEFSAKAVLQAKRTRAKCRGGRSPDGKQVIPSAAVDACSLHIPPADAVFDVRAKSYEVVVREANRRQVKQVLAEGFHLPSQHPRARKGTDCLIGPIGSGRVELTVSPLGWFGSRGKPLIFWIE